MKPYLQILIAASLMFTAPAAVVLNFDTTAEGFGAVSWNVANGSPAWTT